MGARLCYIPLDMSDVNYYSNSDTDAMTYGARSPAAVNNRYESKVIVPIDSTENRLITFNRAGPCMAMYWKGMEPDKNSIRIDFLRRFNMVPMKQMQYIVDVDSPNPDIDGVETV